MKKYSLLLLLIIFLGVIIWIIRTTSSSSPPIPTQTNQKTIVPNFDSIIIIVMENKGYQNIIGNLANAPYINKLAQDNSLANNYFALTRPSLPNYLAILGGSTYGIKTDCNNCFLDANNLVDLLEANNKTWKAYMDSMPSPCFVGNSGKYAQKHNPFIYFNNIKNNSERCKNIVPYTQLSKDLSTPLTTSNLIWITPDMCHDMHDCSIKTGDDWLAKEVPVILNSTSLNLGNSLLIITFDEGDLYDNNHIPTILIGQSVKQNYVSQTRYDHYSLLKTIETAWGLEALTENDKNAYSMSDFFKP